jgi:Fur family ferric uptake transcriptional regulator
MSAIERNTKQRQAIRDAIEQAGGPVSPAEIHDLAKSSVAKLGMATVYRTIKSLVEEGQIVHVVMPGEPPRYEIAGKAHHHHFFCRRCRKMYEVEGCPGDLSKITPAGFKLENHDLLLMGVCAPCGKRR